MNGLYEKWFECIKLYYTVHRRKRTNCILWLINFKGNCDHEILQWFRSNRMATTFEQTYIPSNLLSTAPAPTASVERSCQPSQDAMSGSTVISLNYQQGKKKYPSWMQAWRDRISITGPMRMDRTAKFRFK